MNHPVEQLRTYLEATRHAGTNISVTSLAMAPSQMLYMAVSTLDGEDMLYRIPSLLLDSEEQPFDGAAVDAWLTNPLAFVGSDILRAHA